MPTEYRQIGSVQNKSSSSESLSYYLNPLRMTSNLWANRELIGQFTKRQVLQRYQGSYLGLLWSFVIPLVMLVVYTFVFSVVFKIRWEGGTDAGNHAEFALALFAGLIAFNLFSESIALAPGLIVNNPNYVKKVIFPLEILPLSIVGATLINSLFSLVVLLLGEMVILGQVSWVLVYLPLVYLPLIFLSIGLAWFLASLGVFIRDMNQLMGVIVQILFFLTPIFYPISAIPPKLRPLIYLNPLTMIVNSFRQVIVLEKPPDGSELFLMIAGTFGVCLLGYVWFMKSKKTFADVI